MTVAASIILAAIVGGVIFVLLDSWQRRAATPAPADAAARPEATAREPWQRAAARAPLAPPRCGRPRPAPDVGAARRLGATTTAGTTSAPGNLWSGWADRERRAPSWPESAILAAGWPV